MIVTNRSRLVRTIRSWWMTGAYGRGVEAPIGGSSLQALAIRSSAWTVIGCLAQRLVRLGGNVVLARLLFPEAFGLMALVWVFLRGLQMCSDIGIDYNIIQNQRGDEANFLRTAWTLQSIRGIVLWAGSLLIAWPVATFYGAAPLRWLIPVTGITVMLAGFNSTRLSTLNRHLMLGRLTLIQLGSQVVGLAVMIVWAYHSPSVWALVGGAVISSGMTLVLSHIALPGSSLRPQWERDTVDALVHFGKWILCSNAVFFLASQTDRLLLGRYLSVELLGIYSIALGVCDAASQLAIALSRRVLYPACSQIVRRDASAVSSVYYETRRRLDAFVFPVVGALMVGGTPLVGFLYGERYITAGWMLEILTIQVAFCVLVRPAAMCLLAIGNPRYDVAANVTKALWLATTVPLSWHWVGMSGVVWAVALSEVVKLPFLWRGLQRYGVLSVSRELSGLGWIVIGWLCGYLWLSLFPAFSVPPSGRVDLLRR